MSRVLTLEDVLEGITPIVDASPDFYYPQQGEGIVGDERCKCVETYNDDVGWSLPDPSNCEWHFNDDNTCLYIKRGVEGAGHGAACVLGHYFYDVLGFTDLQMYETKSPSRVLDGHGYEAEPRAERFLNRIQTAQDQGYPWKEAYEQAVTDAWAGQ